MSTDPQIPYGTGLTFHGPLSDERADRLVAALAARHPRTVTDFGCGWGELLMRVVSATDGATGTGIEIFGPDVARGRELADERGLTGRVEFREQSGAGHDVPADLVLCVGASQVFGPIPEALHRLRKLVNPGGRLLFGDGFWERPPTPEELSHMWPDASADDHTDLYTLVTQAEDAGFTLVDLQTANRDEWEHFESGHRAARIEWVLENPDHPQARRIRIESNEMRNRFLRGYRDVLGLAYLTLAVPAEH